MTTVPAKDSSSRISAAERRAIGLLRLLAVLSLLFPAIIFTIASIVSYRAHFKEAHSALARSADLVEEHALKVFDSLKLTASEIDEIVRGMSDEDLKRNESALHDRLFNLAQALPDVRNITIFDAAGHPLVSALDYPARYSEDVSKHQYFSAQEQAGSQPFVSNLLAMQDSSNLQFFDLTIRRSSDDGSFRGIIAVAAERQYFQDFYKTVAGVDFDGVALVKANGALLARYPAAPPGSTEPGAAGGLIEAIAKAPGSGEYISSSAADGVQRMFAYRRVEDLPVYVNVSIAVAMIRSDWLAAMVQYLYFGIPATIGLFLLSLRAIHNMREQYRILAELRAEAERREFAEAAWRQSSKMEAIGRLTGGVAHDFNNLLQIMVGRLGRIEKAVENGRAVVSRDLEGLHLAIDRAATLTHRLLAFSRQQPLKVEVVDLNKLVSGMSELLRQTAGDSVAIETVFAGGLWKVMVDANQLENALLNITANARDAMERAGKLTFETFNAYLDEDYAGRHADVTPGQYAVVSVSDTGTGMTPDIIGKIFDPFFTTKAAGQGTGLGLSMVYGFVRQSGGHVAVYSETGQGTTFKIYLPRHHVSVGDIVPPAPRQEITPSGRGEKILVVEDEEEVRLIIVETLRDMGYAIISAPDARAALVYIAQEPDIALLLTDVGLPGGMNGRQLADECQRLRPELKILFMTGYARNAIIHHGRVDPGVHLIPKPFTRDALARKILEMLGRDAPV